MKLRHAAAVTLMGWSLYISSIGKTCPKGPNCAYSLELAAVGVTGFKTKEECEKAGAEWLRNRYATAEKNGGRVAVAPAKPQCTEDKSN
jgi:hypothetical protein